MIDRRPQADRILVARLDGEARHHAQGRDFTEDEEAAAVAAIAELALEEQRNGEWRYLEFLQVTSLITADIFMREIPGGTRARHRSRPVELPETDTDHSDQTVPVLFAPLFLEGRCREYRPGIK